MGLGELSGIALFVHERLACRLDYSIICDESWATKTTRVTGRVGERTIDITIVADAGRWILNGRPCAEVDGCIDVDLNFSPSTNLIPIRRLRLEIGQTAEVRAAWLRFPSFALEPLQQSYTRIADRTYRYESAGGRFIAEILVDENGLPVSYGQIWTSEAE